MPPTSSHSSSSFDRDPILTDEDRARILDATDIVSIIGEIVELRPKGKEYVGLCPFHDDSHPSMNVNAEKGVYSCWACDAGRAGSRGGDAVTFVQKYFGLSFSEAMAYLADRAGIVRPEVLRSADPGRRVLYRPVNRPAPVGAAAGGPRVPTPQGPTLAQIDLGANAQGLLALNRQAQGFYRQSLDASDEARRYLFEQRGLSPAIMERYLIGYAPRGFTPLENTLPDYLTSQAVIDAGLVNERLTKDGTRKWRKDFFNDRITFGIRDERGNVIGFGARRMDRADKSGFGPKYLNTPETAVFHKGKNLFGLYEAQAGMAREGCALVCEGYMDVIALANAGIDHAVAAMGTALTGEHARLLLRIVPRLVFCLDGDAAGQNGMLRGLMALMPELERPEQIAFVVLDPGKDPDEQVREQGAEAFRKRLGQPIGLLGFLDRIFTEPVTPGAEQAQARAQQIDALIKAMPQFPELGETLRRRATRWCAGQVGARPALRARGSYRINTPEQRLWQAVRACPRVAGAMREEILNWAQSQSQTREPAFVTWLAQYDVALRQGFERPANLPERFREGQADVVRAALSILAHHLATTERDRLSRQSKNRFAVPG